MTTKSSVTTAEVVLKHPVRADAEKVKDMPDLYVENAVNKNSFVQPKLSVFIVIKFGPFRERLKEVQILLNNSQAGPSEEVKQEQEVISRNHKTSF